MYFPFTNVTYILTFPTTSLEQFLRTTWNAISQSIVLILPQIKFNSQLSCFAFDSFISTNEVTQSGLPSFAWILWGTKDLVPAVAPCTPLSPWGVQMNLGKSLTVLRSPTLADDSECYVTVYKEYLPSQLKDTGRVGWEARLKDTRFCSAVGDWVVLTEQVGKKLIWHFSSVWLPS